LIMFFFSHTYIYLLEGQLYAGWDLCFICALSLISRTGEGLAPKMISNICWMLNELFFLLCSFFLLRGACLFITGFEEPFIY
jgi:hypothetical protein